MNLKNNKLVRNLKDLKALCLDYKSSDQKIIMTNGCFDILHPGHVSYLEKAKQNGDILIVGLNSDKSVRNIKGISRPINSQKDRIIMLTALESVDYVVTFEEDTPYDTYKDSKYPAAYRNRSVCCISTTKVSPNDTTCPRLSNHLTVPWLLIATS